MAAERTVRIKFDGSATGLATASAKARAELKALEAQTEKNKKNLNAFAGNVLKGAGSLAKFAQKVASLATVLNVLPALAGGAVTLAGALPLAVAGGFALAGVMTTIKLGADGAKAAFSKLTPTLDTLKKNVSSSFESSLTPAVNNLKTVLPKLTSGFQQIASAVGGVATKTTIMLKSGAATSQLQSILGNTARVVQNLGKGFAPIIAAFIRIGAVAMPILVQLTSGFGAVGEKFNAWIQGAADSGALDAWIHNALDLFKQIFHVVGQVVDIVRTVFSDLSDAGVGLGGVLGPVLDQVQAFVHSAEGHDAIVALATAISSVGTAVGAILGAALVAIAPMIPPLASAFSQLATTVSAILLPVISFLAPALQRIATFIGENTSWIIPLVVALGVWAVAQWALNAAMAANPITLVIIAITAIIVVIALIIEHLDFFRGVWDAVWKFVSDVITTVVNWFRNQWQTIWDWLTGLWRGITGFFAGVWDGVTNKIGQVVRWVGDVWNGAVEGIKGFFRGLGSFVGGIWDGIISGLKGAVNALIRFANSAIHGVNRVTGVVGIPAIPDIPQLARGGTASAGRAYLVGERGPELFTPGQTGRVTDTAQTFGGTQTIELTLDIGEAIKQRIAIDIDRNNKATARALTAGAGNYR